MKGRRVLGKARRPRRSEASVIGQRLGPIADLDAWARRAKERIAGRPVVVSVSGGKDSTAMGLVLKEAGISFRAVHFDTGWEHPATEEYVKTTLPEALGVEVEVLRGRYKGMVDLIRRRGIFPGARRRFCTEELKLFPAKKLFNSYTECEPVSAVGIRSAESEARSKYTEWEDSTFLNCEVWRPLLSWTEGDVIALHRHFGVKPNPLYLMGARRVGCWPCVYARKEELRLIGEIDPGRIDLVRTLEGEVTKTVEGKRGPISQPVTMFKRRTKEGFASFPIDDVMEWAKTSRGGRQFQLFPPDGAAEGCMRWGMCESHAKKDDKGWEREA